MFSHKPTSNDDICLICDRIADIKAGTNPYFVTELHTGYVVIGDHQLFKGYTLFLYREHKTELHELDPETKTKFLGEMSLVAEAVFKAFKPRKLNYELLGNTDNHMHWHIFPRHHNDPLPQRTIWNVDKEIRNAESNKPDQKTLESLKQTLLEHLELVIKKASLETDRDERWEEVSDLTKVEHRGVSIDNLLNHL